MPQPQNAREAVGWHVEVFWEGEGEWFPGVVSSCENDTAMNVSYDDGDHGPADFEDDQIRFLNQGSSAQGAQEGDFDLGSDNEDGESSVDVNSGMFSSSMDSSADNVAKQSDTELEYSGWSSGVLLGHRESREHQLACPLRAGTAAVAARRSAARPAVRRCVHALRGCAL